MDSNSSVLMTPWGLNNLLELPTELRRELYEMVTSLLSRMPLQKHFMETGGGVLGDLVLSSSGNRTCHPPTTSGCSLTGKLHWREVQHFYWSVLYSHDWLIIGNVTEHDIQPGIPWRLGWLEVLDLCSHGWWFWHEHCPSFSFRGLWVSLWA